jgi:uncharacterized protein YndB with AHSA1/START domain
MTTSIETRAAETDAVHSTFRIERAYAAPPARVYRAFTDEEAKRRWFVGGEGWEVHTYVADFRVGGREYSRFSFGTGPAMENETFFLDLVPDRRLVFAYRMGTEAGPLSASLVTIELVPQGSGTLLVQTEQGAYLDGSDDGTEREEGWRELLEALAREVED